MLKTARSARELLMFCVDAVCVLTGLTGSVRPLGRRNLATVQDTPVRRYGGLKDQDRIFTNAYLRHDHGIKGALVRDPHPLLITTLTSTVSLVATGIGQKISSSKVTRGSFKRSRIPVCAGVEALVSLAD